MLSQSLFVILALSSAISGATLPLQNGISARDVPVPDDYGYTPPPEGTPFWPPADVGEVLAVGSPMYPNMGMNLTHYHSSTCPQSKMTNYQFLNGTRRDATYQDMMNDLQQACTSTGPEDLMDKWLAQRAAVAWEIYQLANDTLSWFDVSDVPDGGLLPYPPALESVYTAKQQQQQSGRIVHADNFETAKLRRADTENPAGLNLPGASQSQDQVQIELPASALETPPQGPVPVAPDAGANPNVPNSAVRVPSYVPMTIGDTAWDWSIETIGGLVGGLALYGLLDGGAYIPYVKDHPWATNIFGATGITIGFLMGRLNGIFQRARLRRAQRRNDAFHEFTSSQLLGIGELMNSVQEELKVARSIMGAQAVQLQGHQDEIERLRDRLNLGTPSSSSTESGDDDPNKPSSRTRLLKPIKSLSTTTKKATTAAKEKLKKGSRVGKSTLRQAARALNLGTSTSSGGLGSDQTASSAPGGLQTAPFDYEALPEQMQRASSAAPCSTVQNQAITEDTTGEETAAREAAAEAAVQKA